VRRFLREACKHLVNALGAFRRHGETMSWVDMAHEIAAQSWYGHHKSEGGLAGRAAVRRSRHEARPGMASLVIP
jgi:hypothetical protein